MLRKSIGLLAATALGLGLVQSASAADLPVKAAPPVAYVAPINWTGFYFGGHVGSGWGTTEASLDSLTVSGFPVLPPGTGGFPLASAGRNGFIAGVQAGYNWQLSPFLVVGLEGDFSWSDVKGTSPCGPGFGGTVFSCRAEDNWIGDITGRIGVTVDHALLYLKGGWAWQDTDYTVSSVSFGGGPGLLATASNTHDGGLLGAGVEYQFMQHWSAKIEYNYIDFRSNHVNAIGTAPFGPCAAPTCPLAATATVTEPLHLIKAGFNYRF